MPNISQLRQNRLLSALSPATQKRLLQHMEPVELVLKETLTKPGDRLTFACFPQAGMISILIPLRDAGPIEVGTIGPEGMLGTDLLVSGEISVHSAIVQAPGAALRIPAPALRQELEGNRSLRLRLGRYAQSFHFQVSQTAACNGAHTVHQRTARWLMLARHRIGSDELPLTQEFLSMMLGVERPGVTLAAGSLQKAGIIRYARGKITILDPGGLENVACECSRRIVDQEAVLLA